MLVANTDRGSARDRSVGRGRQLRARPRSAPAAPTSPTCSSCSVPTSSFRAWRLRGGAGTSRRCPRGRSVRARGQGVYDVFLAELALWERRWPDADRAVHDGLEMRALPASRSAARLVLRQGTPRASRLAALARARRDTEAAQAWLAKARKLIAVARRSAQEASAVTPNADGWLVLGRSRVRARPEHRPARIVVGSSCGLGAARAHTPRGLLPLARGRITRRRRRLPHRGGQTRSGRRMPSPLASAPSRCCANSTSSPSAPGSTPTHPKVSHPTAGTTCSSRSASRDARQRCSASSPAATPTARSPTRSSSASRPPASTSHTSCESSTRPTDARQPRSRTASPTRPPRIPSAPGWLARLSCRDQGHPVRAGLIAAARLATIRHLLRCPSGL